MELSKIEFDNNSIQACIKKIEQNYIGISGDILNNALSRTINRAADASKTAANKAIRQKYNISQTIVSKEITIKRSSKASLTAIITAKGSALSLSQFQAKQVTSAGTKFFDRKGASRSKLGSRISRKKTVAGVTATISKGNAITLPYAFIASSNSGTTVFARGAYHDNFKTAKARLPIAKITTVAIPLMFAGDDVMSPTLKLTEFDFSKRFEHELSNLMNS